jgi:putative ABC transport system ATP-binding protein
MPNILTSITTPSPNTRSSNTTPSSSAVLNGGGRDIHVNDLTISYQRGSQTVSPVRDMQLYAGSSQVTALVGRSGSGKTSILSCIAGMLQPAAGTIWLGGIEVTKLHGKSLDNYRRGNVGVVHQAYNLIASLSARDNVAVPLMLAGVDRRSALNTATTLLDRLGIANLANTRPGEMSGGQQQRVAVARALSTNPSVVIADEPTAHLDGSSVADVRNLLRSIADEGRTVVLSTHDDRLLEAVDQTIHLSAA